jgi:phage terminase small subunit
MKIKRTEPKDLYKSVIDQYYINGFNGVQAVRKVKGQDYNYHSAASLFNTIMKHEHTKEYIQSKRTELKRNTYIENENILRELLNFAFSDITDYVGLTREELKKLPQDIRRCIESIAHKKKRYTNRLGEDVEEETITVKLIDKIKAIEMINKHIGFYAEDNQQKKSTINLDKVDVHTLNVLLNAIEEK